MDVHHCTSIAMLSPNDLRFSSCLTRFVHEILLLFQPSPYVLVETEGEEDDSVILNILNILNIVVIGSRHDQYR